MDKYSSIFNKTRREYVLANISKFNSLSFVASYHNDNDFILKMEGKARHIYFKEMAKIFNFCKEMGETDAVLDYAENLLYDIPEFRNILFKDENKKVDKKFIDKSLKMVNKYSNKDVKDLIDYMNILTATTLLITGGKLTHFNEMPKQIQESLDYEFSKDVYLNMVCLTNLGEDLSYMYLRSKLIKVDMPMFVTKELKGYYNKMMKELYIEPIKWQGISTIMRLEYETEKEKKLYEEVFPEFNFKYEDRENNEPNCYNVSFEYNKDL